MDRDFKGVWIPKEIWLDNRLNALDKVILTEIDSLDNGESGCYASNKYIADFCQCSEVKVSRAISKLIEYGYLKLSSFDGRTRVLQSCIVKNARLPCQKDKAESSKRQVSTIENNTVNNKDNIYIGQVVDYLNEKAGTKYRASSANTKRHIHARLAEGFTLDDFKAVIDKKCADWKGTEWEKFLRPETLFGSKFESYLNAQTSAREEVNPYAGLDNIV